MVAYLEKHENSRFLKMLNPRIECVTSLRSRLIAQAVFNPGSSAVIRELVSIDNPGTSFRIDIPKERRRSDSASSWPSSIRNIAPSPLGIPRIIPVNPNQSSTRLQNLSFRAAMSLLYIAEHRIDRIVDWKILDPIPSEMPVVV